MTQKKCEKCDTVLVNVDGALCSDCLPDDHRWGNCWGDCPACGVLVHGCESDSHVCSV